MISSKTQKVFRFAALGLGFFVLIFTSGCKFYIPDIEGPVKHPELPLYKKYARQFAEQQRNLVSVEVITPYIAEPKQIALTFDDGPSPRSTRKILSILRKYHVPATFFVVGMHAQLDQQLIKEISAGGNELCVHTYHHYDLSKLKEDGIAKELNETNDILSSILGERFSFFRPPGGQYNQLVLRTARKNHYAMVLWDINPADFVDLENNMPTEPVILAEIIEKLNGSRRARIILLHENMLNTVDALSGIIEYGLSHGFTFTTVSSLKFKPNFKI